nr:unnamed protein product [Callosobruchus chinensis]
MSITDDKTPAQISHLNLLREELNRRQAAGERDITIKYVSDMLELSSKKAHNFKKVFRVDEKFK